MNYEEKILEALGQIGERLDRLETTQAKQGELLAELDDRSLRSAVALEGTGIPKLQLLYEGQENLRQTLTPRERVDVLEDEVITLKTVVKSMSRRLATLEKAQ